MGPAPAIVAAASAAVRSGGCAEARDERRAQEAHQRGGGHARHRGTQERRECESVGRIENRAHECVGVEHLAPAEVGAVAGHFEGDSLRAQRVEVLGHSGARAEQERCVAGFDLLRADAL